MGPWLPIYGLGSVLILTILNRLRSHPVIEFITAIVLCGFLEYIDPPSLWNLPQAGKNGGITADIF